MKIGIRFCKFALANSGDAVNKNVLVGLEGFMQIGKRRIPTAEIRTRLWGLMLIPDVIEIKLIVRDSWKCFFLGSITQ